MLQHFAVDYPELTESLYAEGRMLSLADYAEHGVVGIESWNTFRNWHDRLEEAEALAKECVGTTDYMVQIMVHVAGEASKPATCEQMAAIDLQVYEYSNAAGGGWRQATDPEKYDLLFG